MNDPYRILGLSSDASRRELRRAWRRLKKAYRPVRFSAKELRLLSGEHYLHYRNAYRQALRMQKEGIHREQPRQEPLSGSTDPFLPERARSLLEEGRYGDAEALLLTAAPSLRNAYWHYLMGLVLQSRAYFLDAQRMLETACRIDPENTEYQAAQRALSEEVKKYGKGYRLSRGDLGDQTTEACCECCGAIACEGCCEGICEGICSGLG